MYSAPASTSLVVTDLDGTLAGPGGVITAEDRLTLEALGRRGVLRAVATGRSATGARHVLPDDFPIDYLVFSSGAGVLDWKEKRLLLSHNLSSEQVREGCRELLALEVDFMVHHPIPDNHHFLYWDTRRGNADFENRCRRHAHCCTPWDGLSEISGASQFLVVDPTPRSGALHERLQATLGSWRVIRATSPLDGASSWLEIFSTAVSKSQGVQWVADREGVPATRVLAVGNDYNDIDMLHWAGTRFVVGNTPEDLRRIFPSVRSHSESGFTEAVSRWSAT